MFFFKLSSSVSALDLIWKRLSAPLSCGPLLFLAQRCQTRPRSTATLTGGTRDANFIISAPEARDVVERGKKINPWAATSLYFGRRKEEIHSWPLFHGTHLSIACRR